MCLVRDRRMRFLLLGDTWMPVSHDIEDVFRLFEWEKKGWVTLLHSDAVKEWKEIWRKL